METTLGAIRTGGYHVIATSEGALEVQPDYHEPGTTLLGRLDPEGVAEDEAALRVYEVLSENG